MMMSWMMMMSLVMSMMMSMMMKMSIVMGWMIMTCMGVMAIISPPRTYPSRVMDWVGKVAPMVATRREKAVEVPVALTKRAKRVAELKKEVVEEEVEAGVVVGWLVCSRACLGVEIVTPKRAMMEKKRVKRVGVTRVE
uniref:Uncharacterized protein n=1 Tax=Opuntia streptacantha TaxID=393608 RepID=A0A7C9EEN0_OPUST